MGATFSLVKRLRFAQVRVLAFARADEVRALRRLGGSCRWVWPGAAGFMRKGASARRREIRGLGALRLAIGGVRGVRAAFAERERF